METIQRLVEEDPRRTHIKIETSLGVDYARVGGRKFLSITMEAERVRFCREVLEMLKKNGGYRTFTKIVTDDKTYIPFYGVPTRQES